MAASALVAVASLPAIALAQNAADVPQFRKIVLVGDKLNAADMQKMLRAHPEAKGAVIRRVKGSVFMVSYANVTPAQAARQGIL